MELRIADCPIEAFELVNENSAFYTINKGRKCERIRLALAGQRTHNSKPACSIVTLVSQHESGSALRLLTTSLRIEIQENDVASFGHVAAHHSTDSFPTCRPVEISGYRFSWSISATSLAREGTFTLRRSSIWPLVASISRKSPSLSPASSTRGFGILTARLFPHFTICAFITNS